MFQRTTAINKISQMSGFIGGVQGGTSAGKTYAILPLEANFCMKNPGTETSVVSESVPHLRRGAIKDFMKIMKETGRWNANNWNATNFKYTFTPPRGYTGSPSYIEFFSADNDSKLRGARRNRLYINEANNISFDAYQELSVRTFDHIFLDWNPTAEFWFHKELKDDDNVDFLVINYLDNEACPQSAVDAILRAKEKAETSDFWKNWYKVYGLGQTGILEDVVFSNYKFINKVPNSARLLGYGLDFGYANDPAALISVWLWNGKRILHEEFYQKGLLNSSIYNMIPDKTAPIWADSAEPKSIDELKMMGLDIEGVVKGADSIRFGIQTMQSQEYLVTQSSLNFINELRQYRYIKGKPIDAFNHGIDAVRYHETMTIGGQEKNYETRIIS